VETIEYQPIGFIRSPYQDIEGMPIQPPRSMGVKGTIEILEAYRRGLKDLEGFSHLILLYHFHQVEASLLVVTPFLDSKSHGVFATRAPCRPNPIGLSIVELIRIENGTLHIADVDILDETPLLDIKPYVPDFDQPRDVRSGWISACRSEIPGKRSDRRFKPGEPGSEGDSAS
jgi:tRNA-Thr(GGU) m(6)t(6)A37 methyltransferase TsaA